ncbi:hypothetical protein [Iningainema tapete]|uniref:Uncharacterized protein n=1 Tax=Iningainema tapete BLCC-T55 TaxID=2748662 RepID=A0A8J7CEM8_9CYAN|nr:hypothetical protein [Iningainema tapete]MBD2773715.1 hypothetical protein [Iningainema tapete BLCC-T55]
MLDNKIVIIAAIQIRKEIENEWLLASSNNASGSITKALARATRCFP